MGHTGGSIMVHGVCSSAGCFSMTDAQIAEIYGIAREAFASGQRAIQMQSYPFHMTAENLAKYRLDPNIGFWNQLKEGSDNFEATKQDVAVGVCNKHYVFNAVPADGSHFDATAGCPPLKRNGETQAEVTAKQKRDEAKIAELAAHGLRPVHTVYADGGQHPDFASLASYASRPEALAKVPVDIALDEGKSKKARRMVAAKPDAIRTAANSVQGQSPKPVETPTTAAPEPAKPQNSSLFARLWGGKPAETKAETPSLPSIETAVPQPAEVPLPPRRKEASTAVAKPRDANGRPPQNSVAAPAPVKPQAAASPAPAAAGAVAFLRAKVSTIAQADH
jgi:hypothetical protein